MTLELGITNWSSFSPEMRALRALARVDAYSVSTLSPTAQYRTPLHRPGQVTHWRHTLPPRVGFSPLVSRAMCSSSSNGDTPVKNSGEMLHFKPGDVIGEIEFSPKTVRLNQWMPLHYCCFAHRVYAIRILLNMREKSFCKTLWKLKM